MQASRQCSGGFAQKLEELSLLLEGYDALCSRGKRDPRDQMTWVLEQLEEGDYAQTHTFYIDGFPDFTRQHLAILEHLIRYSPCVTVSLNCDQVDSGKMAFEKAGKTASELLDSCRRADVEVRIELVEEKSDSLQKIREGLFQGKLSQEQGCSGVLSVFQADSPYAECVAAAEAVLQLVQKGCRYRDISVVCGDIAVYQPILEMVFPRCGIPIYLSGTEEILQKTVISSLLWSMDAALGDFEQREIFRYMKSVLSPLEQEECDALENYAILWGIRGEKWNRLWEQHPDGLGGVWTEEAQEQLRKLNDSREKLLNPLLHLRDEFRKSNCLRQQVLALYQYLEEIQLAKRLKLWAERLDEQGDHRGAQILNQLWEILLTALEQLYDVLGETVWDQELFLRLFALLLSQYDVGTIPPVLDAVTAGPVSAMRCQEAKHLIVLGAQEGCFPGYGGSQGVLTDQERTALREMGVPLTGGAMEGVQAEFAEIYGVFCGASEDIRVFYPSAQPSFVCRRLAEMSGGEKKIGDLLGPALWDPWETGAYLVCADLETGNLGHDVEQAHREVLRRTQYRLGNLTPKQVRGLYGDRLELSASQIDRQAECRLSYFLRYGLRAKERKEAAVDPAEFGTYVHAVLEQTGREIQNLGGFHQVSLEETLKIAENYSQIYAQERFANLDSRRITYLFHRNIRELEMILEELWQELRVSSFEPKDFETAFGEHGKVPAVSVPGRKMHAVLRGFVDRVDTWVQGQNHYFRVVDYKTGKKDFDYCDVFHGVGLQMLLYLFALEESGEAVIGQHPIPAGVQYFPARAPLLNADGRLTEEEMAVLRQKEWKRHGLLLEDEAVLRAMEPEDNPARLSVSRKKDGTLSGDLANRSQLKQLREYVFCVVGQMVDDIASGNVEPNPYTRGTSHDACSFCPYEDICHRAHVSGRRNYKTMTAQRFWEEIEKEVSHGR